MTTPTNYLLFNPNSGIVEDLTDIFKSGNSGILTNYLTYNQISDTYIDIGTIFAPLSGNSLSFNTNYLTNTSSNTYSDLSNLFEAQLKPIGTYSISNNNSYIKINKVSSLGYDAVIFDYEGSQSIWNEPLPYTGNCTIKFNTMISLNYLIIGGGGGGGHGFFGNSSNYSAGKGGGGGSVIYNRDSTIDIPSDTSFNIQVGYPGGGNNNNGGGTGSNSTGGKSGQSYIQSAYYDFSYNSLGGNPGGGYSDYVSGSGGNPSVANSIYNFYSLTYGGGGGGGGALTSNQLSTKNLSIYGGNAGYFSLEYNTTNNGTNGVNGTSTAAGNGGSSYRGTTYITVPFGNTTNLTSSITTNVFCGNGGGGGGRYYGGTAGSFTNGIGGGNNPTRVGQSALYNYQSNAFYCGNGGGGGGAYIQSAQRTGGNGAGGMVMLWAKGNTVLTEDTTTLTNFYPSAPYVDATYIYVKTIDYSAIIFKNTNNSSNYSAGKEITFKMGMALNYLVVGGGGGGGDGSYTSYPTYSGGSGGGGAGIIYNNSNSLTISANSSFQIKVGARGQPYIDAGSSYIKSTFYDISFNAFQGKTGRLGFGTETVYSNGGSSISSCTYNFATNNVGGGGGGGGGGQSTTNYGATTGGTAGSNTYSYLTYSGKNGNDSSNVLNGNGYGGNSYNIANSFSITVPFTNTSSNYNTSSNVYCGNGGGGGTYSNGGSAGYTGGGKGGGNTSGNGMNALSNYQTSGTTGFYYGNGGGGGAAKYGTTGYEDNNNINNYNGGNGSPGVVMLWWPIFVCTSSYLSRTFVVNPTCCAIILSNSSMIQDLSCNITFNRAVTLNYLLVGGGGGGAIPNSWLSSNQYASGGGGGGGGVIFDNSNYLKIPANTTLQITVGAEGKSRDSYTYNRPSSYNGNSARGPSKIVSTLYDISFNAFGGGGGAGFKTTNPSNLANGGNSSYYLNGFTGFTGSFSAFGGGGGGGGGAITTYDNLNYTIKNQGSGGTNGFTYPAGNPPGNGGLSYYGTNNITVPFAISNPGSNVNTPVYCGNGGGGGSYSIGGSAGSYIAGVGAGSKIGQGESASSGYTTIDNKTGFYYGNGGGGGNAFNSTSRNGGNGANGVVMLWAFSNTAIIENVTCTITNPINIKTTFVSTTGGSTNYSGVIFDYSGNNTTPGSCTIQFTNSLILNFLLVGGGCSGMLGRYSYYASWDSGAGGAGGGIIFNNENSLPITAGTSLQIQVGYGGRSPTYYGSKSYITSSLYDISFNALSDFYLSHTFIYVGGASSLSSTPIYGGDSFYYLNPTIGTGYLNYGGGGGGGGGGASSQINNVQVPYGGTGGYYNFMYRETYIESYGGPAGTYYYPTNFGNTGNNGSNSSTNSNPGNGSGGNSYYGKNYVTVPFTISGYITYTNGYNYTHYATGPVGTTKVFCGNGGGGGIVNYGGRGGGTGGGTGGGNIDRYGTNGRYGYGLGTDNSDYFFPAANVINYSVNSSFFAGNGGGGSGVIPNYITNEFAGSGSPGMVMLWWYT
jgi:hypothetical protein